MTRVLDWQNGDAAVPSADARGRAQQRQARLTKPQGALGRLEKLAVRLAGLQETEQPTANPVRITIFAGDHGVVSEGVSAFPQAVTAQMIRNFSAGGAAISVLARQLDVALEVLNLGTIDRLEALPDVTDVRLGSGTANICSAAAMNEVQLERALAAGRETVEKVFAAGASLFVAGEMGIGNTTAASAIASALLDLPVEALVGPGTGLDEAAIGHKVVTIRRALARHATKLSHPLEILRRLGGFEIAALTGSYLACAKRGHPVLVDGFISTVAALVAARQCPGAGQWFLYSHGSAEPGHHAVLEALGAQPLLNLEMRLGEASGAAVALPLIQMACTLHNQMATFEEAQVAEGPTASIPR